jgi:hypothetical protein
VNHSEDIKVVIATSNHNGLFIIINNLLINNLIVNNLVTKDGLLQKFNIFIINQLNIVFIWLLYVCYIKKTNR